MGSTWLDMGPYSVSLGVRGGVRVPTGDDVEVDSSCQRDLVVAPGGWGSFAPRGVDSYLEVQRPPVEYF